MPHETDLIFTLTAALVAATIAGHIAVLMRLPAIVGFLVAGVILSPFTPGPTASSEIASQFAEIGVILLMFGVGIHFSLRGLFAVQSVALPAAIAQTVILTAAVAGVLLIWGWSLSSSLLFGLAVSIASTVIVIEFLEGRHELNTTHGRIAVGWLIVEDLIIVLVLIFAPVLSELSNDSSSVSIAGILALFGITIGKVAALFVVMIVVGSRVVPWLLIQSARIGSRELFMATVLATAIGIAYISATLFDVSFALGAFLAGLVISEDDLSHQAAADALPFKDAFALLFFVSIGMLFDPDILIESPLLVGITVIFIALIKPLLNIFILTPFGMSRHAVGLMAATRAQIGEFSFVLATMGLSLAIFDDEAFSILLAGAIIAIFLSPLVFVLTGQVTELVDRLYHRIHGERVLLDLVHEQADELTDHAVILGYGRVGSLIGAGLVEHGLHLTIVESNRYIVEELREAGQHVIFGNAESQPILEHLSLPTARVLIVALGDEIPTYLAVERARQLAPKLPIVARVHSVPERERLEVFEHVFAVMGEQELAAEMTRWVIRISYLDISGDGPWVESPPTDFIPGGDPVASGSST